MVSTFHGIEMGKRSLMTHSQAMNVVGHNISNSNTEGYSRQVINIGEYEPIFMPHLVREERPGQLGQGNMTLNIKRVRDILLDNRLIAENRELGFFEIKNKYIHQMEMVYTEPTLSNDHTLVNTLRTSLDDFIGSFADIANHPEELSARVATLEKANTLANSVRHHFEQFTHIRNNSDSEIQDKVKEINNIAKNIATLNDKILRSEAVGDNPNDWLDQRDRLIDKLSKIVDVQISREDKDELIIFIGGRHLVQGQKYEELKLISNANNNGYFDTYWTDGEKLAVRGGELAGLLEIRDKDLLMEIKRIDSFAANLTDMINEIHRGGFGANGETGNDFFVQFPFVTDPLGNYDRNRDGADDSSYIFRVTGENKLDLYDKIGIRGNMNINGITVSYYETDTLQEVVRKINDSGARVNAFLNPDGKLSLKADYQMDPNNPDFVIRHVEDDGMFLIGYAGILKESGAAGSFDWQATNQVDKFKDSTNWTVSPLTNPSAYMSVNERIKSDVSYIAAASGTDINGDGTKVFNGVGDTSNAMNILSLKEERVMIGMSQTFSQYFEYIVADVGARGSHVEKGFKNAEVITTNLENMRKSISGVNLDEEFANMIKFQHGYNATAKIMSEMDKMIETLILKL